MTRAKPSCKHRDMDTKEKALDYLRKHPLDYNGAAKLLEMGFLEFMEFRGLHLSEFMAVEEETYNLIEHLTMLQALGQELPEEYANFDFQKARFVLQCRKGWNATTKVQRVGEDKKPKSRGMGKKMLDDYFNKSKIGVTEDEGGIEILSETKRRNLQ